MSDITNIQADDRVKDSRAVINTNFDNLNTDKAETLSDLGVTKTSEEINANLPSADEKAAMSGGGSLGTPSTTNKFLTEDVLPTVGPTQVVEFTSSGTWTKDNALVRIRVQAWGGGGGGSSVAATGIAAGGGGGGYLEAWIEADDLSATETVTIGAGGAPTVAGQNTTFGSLVTAYGGAGASGTTQGAGGGIQPGNVFAGTTSGANGLFWGGGAGGSGVVGGGSLFGAGGGGGGASVNSRAGGTSSYGGNGGTGTVGGTNAGNGVSPGGGGGGCNASATAGSGAAGKVIVTEYYQ